MEKEQPGKNLLQVAGLFFKLGTTSFGGPSAHIALIEQEVCRWCGEDIDESWDICPHCGYDLSWVRRGK